MDVWLGGGGEKNVVGLRSFLSKPTKMFSPQNGEKIKVKSLICLLTKMLMRTYS